MEALSRNGREGIARDLPRPVYFLEREQFLAALRDGREERRRGVSLYPKQPGAMLFILCQAALAVLQRDNFSPMEAIPTAVYLTAYPRGVEEINFELLPLLSPIGNQSTSCRQLFAISRCPLS